MQQAVKEGGEERQYLLNFSAAGKKAVGQCRQTEKNRYYLDSFVHIFPHYWRKEKRFDDF